MIINQDSGYLMIDIANRFVETGYKVTLITGRLVERNTPLDDKVYLDKIIRYRRSTMFSKLITWSIATTQILFKTWTKYSRDYLFIVSNPPLAPLISLFCNNKYSLLIYDVYVDSPESIPILKKLSFLIKIWKNAYSRVFSDAESIFTLTVGMASSIERYSGDIKCNIVPLWTDNELLKPVKASSNPFIAEHNLTDKFIVLYSGSIGESSGVDYLVEVASCIDFDQIVFVIIGEGSKKSALIRKIESLALKNCIILPWQQVSVLPYSLASANLAVVTLTGNTSHNAIPSKLFNYVSVGSPILCLGEPASDLGQLVNKEGIGKCFNPTMKEEIAEFIIQLYNDPAMIEKFKNSSLRTSKKFTSENASQFVSGINKINE